MVTRTFFNTLLFRAINARVSKTTFVVFSYRLQHIYATAKMVIRTFFNTLLFRAINARVSKTTFVVLPFKNMTLMITVGSSFTLYYLSKTNQHIWKYPFIA